MAKTLNTTELSKKQAILNNFDIIISFNENVTHLHVYISLSINEQASISSG